MKIMVIGSFNGTNYGDNAILDSIVSQIEKKFGEKCEIYIPCGNKFIKKTFNGKEHIKPLNIGIRSGTIRFFGISTILALFKIDKIVTTAGILFDYNSHKFIRSSFTVSLFPLFILAKLFNKEIIGLNVGIINNKTRGQWFLKRVLKKHDIIYLRDPGDELVIKEMDIDTPVIKSADIVFTNEILKGYPEKLEINDKPVLGINLNKYIDIHAQDSSETSTTSFLKNIANNIDNLINTYKCKVVFIPTAKMDIHIHREVIQLINQKNECKLIEKENWKELVTEINLVDIFIGMRMHSLIFATILNKPVISINYSPKVRGFMKQLDLEKFSYNIKEISMNTFSDSVGEILRNYNYFKELQKTNAELLERKASRSLESL